MNSLAASTFAISKSYGQGSVEINCITLCNEFSAKVFRSLVKGRIKNENCLSTSFIVGVVNTEIFEFH